MNVSGAEAGRARWAVLGLLVVAELLGMSPWFSASAVAPDLEARWGLDPAQTSWLATAVQIGFVAGTALVAVTNIADLIPSRALFAGSALLAAGANALVLPAGGFAEALLPRFMTGFFLAGVYPPAMKMAATWFRAARGLAIGSIVAGLTVGKATPFLLKAAGAPEAELVMGGASAGALMAGALVLLFYRDGPLPFDRKPFSWGLVGEVARDRETRLATGGYLGHMWELYAMWALVGLFFHDLLVSGGGATLAGGVSEIGESAGATAGSAAAGASGVGAVADAAGADALAALLAFSVIAIGGVGAVLAGRWADRFGRERVASAAMAVSALCSLGIGWLAGAPLALVVAVALLWGFSIVADSAQFSALVTEVAPSHAVGTALTLQTMLGFALTGVSIQLCAWVAEGWGWGPAFSLLAVGPLLGIVAMRRLHTARARAARFTGRPSSSATRAGPERSSGPGS